MKPQADVFLNGFRRPGSASALFLIALMLAACTPTPQKVAMPDPSNTTQSSAPEQSVPKVIAAVTGTKIAAPGPLADTPAEALGRRTLSTAFVRVGPDGHLTVELLDGRIMVLRDVIMGPKDYCGVHVASDSARTQYCGGYAQVAAARPGGGAQLDSEVSNAGEPARGPVKGE